jgi:hypothetical protein
MNITYTWKITSLKTTDEGSHKNAVVQTYWQKIGTDEDGNTGTFTGATPFTSVSVPDEEFLPFEELTEEIVLGWIQNVVVNSYEAHVNEKILQQIINTKQPIIEQKMPWAPQEENAPITPTPVV